MTFKRSILHLLPRKEHKSDSKNICIYLPTTIFTVVLELPFDELSPLLRGSRGGGGQGVGPQSYRVP